MVILPEVHLDCRDDLAAVWFGCVFLQRRWQEERYRTLAMDPHWQRLHKQEYQAKQRLDAACEEQRDHHQCHRCGAYIDMLGAN
jgi:hypothetical protein